MSMFSVSRVTKYEECPSKYRLHYLLNIREDGNRDAMDRGTCVHKGIETYLNNYSEDHEYRLSTALVASENCDTESISADIRSEAREIAEFYLPLLKDRIGEPVLLNNKPLVEFEFEANFSSYGIGLQGKIDAVVKLPDGRTALLDWKIRGNSQNFYRTAPLQMDKQLPVYAAILRHVYKVPIDVAFQVQMSAALPSKPLLYKGSNPAFANSYYLKGKTTAGTLSQFFRDFPDEERSHAALAFFDKVVDPLDYLMFSEVDLTHADKYLHYTLRRAKQITEDKEFLPILNGYQCKYCPVLVQCRETYIG